MKIICHPKNYEIIKRQLKAQDDSFKPFGIECIHRPFAFNIVTNDYIPEGEWTGKYLRNNNILPDDKFCSWIDDINNPPSWAVYFGLVDKEFKAVYYICNSSAVIKDEYFTKIIPTNQKKKYI